MKFKNEVRSLLNAEDYSRLAELSGGHGGKVGIILISLLGDLDETIRWRAVKGLGLVTALLYERDPEQARRVLRQLIWNLNEESGGIGWGMPEAFGEILARQPDLAREYVSLLAGYLVEAETALDQETLQAGVIWALGRVKNFPGEIRDRIIPKLIGLLDHPNAGLRGLAAWSLGELNAREALPFLDDLPEEDRMISLLLDEKFTRMPLSELTSQVKEKLRDL